MFPHISTEALVCALVLSEEGNLSRTADRLHTSPSNVGRKVKSLQTGWGVQLFSRSLTGFELTAEGRVSVQEIRKSIEYAQRGFDRALYQAIRNRRPFRVGHSLYIHNKVLPFLEKLNASPDGFSGLVLQSATTMQLKTRVLRGEIQVGFGVMPVFDKDLYVAPVLSEGFSLCIPETHLLRGKVRIAAQDAANERLNWIPRAVHPAFYDHVTSYLRGVGYDLHSFHDARGILEGIDFAAYKSGVSLVPHSAARFQRPGVLFKPLTDRLMRIETVLFVRRDQMHGAVREFVHKALAELQPSKAFPQ
jgi:LysR family transcriptional regulator, benzoate and cis,cis-muconate-responsive activator of ben and cat genes